MKRNLTWDWDGAKLRLYDNGDLIEAVRLSQVAELMAFTYISKKVKPNENPEDHFELDEL